MSALSDLHIVDIRNLLPRRGTTRRYPGRTSFTLHYNGGAVAMHNSAGATTEMWIEHMIGIANYHIKKVWGYVDKRKTIPIYGHGVMYHYAILPSGVILWMRDLDEELWHCSNPEGNRRGLAAHFPLGGDQAPTAPQWDSFGRLVLACGIDFEFGVDRVFGHTEWPKYVEDSQGKLIQVANSACPGDIIMPMIERWRAGGWHEQQPQPAPMQYLKTIWPATVRTAPSRDKGAVVMTMPKGTVCGFKGITTGQSISGSNRWWHRGDELGFVHESALRVA